MKTKNGIELELNKSEYKVNYKGFNFHFSSKIYMDKFKEQIKEYINLEQTKLYNKYKIKTDYSIYLAFSLYKKIEKRGFYIVYKDYIFIPEDIEFETFIK